MWTVCQRPNDTGTSRHVASMRMTHSIPASRHRWSYGGRPAVDGGGRMTAMRAQRASECNAFATPVGPPLRVRSGTVDMFGLCERGGAPDSKIPARDVDVLPPESTPRSVGSWWPAGAIRPDRGEGNHPSWRRVRMLRARREAETVMMRCATWQRDHAGDGATCAVPASESAASRTTDAVEFSAEVILRAVLADRSLASWA